MRQHYANPERVFEGIPFSLPSILARSPPPSRSLNPAGRGRRAERGDGFAHGRTWSMFRVFREINPLVLSTYTRRRRSAATPVSAYTHGISIIWIVKVFGRQLQPPNLCSPPSYSSRLPGTITHGCPLRRTLHSGNIDATRDAYSSREFELERRPLELSSFTGKWYYRRPLVKS